MRLLFKVNVTEVDFHFRVIKKFQQNVPWIFMFNSRCHFRDEREILERERERHESLQRKACSHSLSLPSTHLKRESSSHPLSLSLSFSPPPTQWRAHCLRLQRYSETSRFLTVSFNDSPMREREEKGRERGSRLLFRGRKSALEQSEPESHRFRTKFVGSCPK